MFTGLIQELGTLRSINASEEGASLAFGCSKILDGLVVGESVACDGVCLSVEKILPDGFEVYAVRETLARSTFGLSFTPKPVNLERALAAGDRLGGHFVAGHVDAVGLVSERRELADGSLEMQVQLEPAQLKYCVEKGSIALNGVSLTIAGKLPGGVLIALIPITLEQTNLSELTVGESLNVEVDMMAKHVESLMGAYLEKNKE